MAFFSFHPLFFRNFILIELKRSQKKASQLSSGKRYFFFFLVLEKIFQECVTLRLKTEKSCSDWKKSNSFDVVWSRDEKNNINNETNNFPRIYETRYGSLYINHVHICVKAYVSLKVYKRSRIRGAASIYMSVTFTEAFRSRTRTNSRSIPTTGNIEIMPTHLSRSRNDVALRFVIETRATASTIEPLIHTDARRNALQHWDFSFEIAFALVLLFLFSKKDYSTCSCNRIK